MKKIKRYSALRRTLDILSMVIYRHREYYSPINGRITVTTILGAHDVETNSIQQNGPYLEGMWRSSIENIRRHAPAEIREILMLGLGGGQGVRIFQEHFPNSNITVIEYDRTMIEIALELHQFNQTLPVKIIEGDAQLKIDTLPSSYDFVIMDLFTPDAPSNLGGDEHFLNQIKRVLTEEGIMIANVYDHHQYLDTMEHVFQRLELWKYQTNHLGIFSK